MSPLYVGQGFAPEEFRTPWRKSPCQGLPCGICPRVMLDVRSIPKVTRHFDNKTGYLTYHPSVCNLTLQMVARSYKQLPASLEPRMYCTTSCLVKPGTWSLAFPFAPNGTLFAIWTAAVVLRQGQVKVTSEPVKNPIINLKRKKSCESPWHNASQYASGMQISVAPNCKPTLHHGP